MTTTDSIRQLEQLGEVRKPSSYQLDGRTPTLALAPASREALCDALRLAAEGGFVVVPWGGGTQMGLGNVPRQFDLALDLRSINRIIRYAPQDLTLAVEAGMSVAALQQVLGQHGQMLPIDCAHPEQTTIGGLIATGLGGPRRYGYGSLRDLLIGITVALPNGQLTRGGGMVVKNVSGYDMMRLHYGALGAFGVIIQVNFKVLPAPRAQRTVLADFATLDQAAEAAMAIRVSQLSPTAIALLNQPARRTIDGQGDGWSLALRCEGPPQAVERQAERIIALVHDYGGHDYLLDEDETSRCWAAVAKLIDATPRTQGVRFRIGERPSALKDLVPAVDLAFNTMTSSVLVVLDIGSGLGYFTVEEVRESQIFQKAWQQVVRLGQHVTLLAAPAELKSDLDVFGRAPAGLAVLRALKATFDPKGTLNAGRSAGKL